MLFRDITEKKLTDEHLKRVDRLVSLGRLSAGIAHEIRNPLTGINLVLEDLHDKLDKEDKNFIKKALQEISRLENIVSELLDYASPVKENFQLFNLIEIIETSIFFIKKQAKEKQIDIVTNFKCSLDIYCSPEKIKQAIINILINAIDAIEFNGQISITTDYDNVNNEVLISISDNGEGIKNEDIKYIFDPFFTTKKKGTGLGLSITHSIIHEHKGRINVESIIGKGTTFTIILLDNREAKYVKDINY
jgi:signal transduction histidine kinase